MIFFINFDFLNKEQEEKKMITETESIQLEITKLTSRIEEIKEKYEELDNKRTTLLEELETESFKPKRRKIEHKLSEICWKMDELEQQQLNLEFDIETTFF